MVALIVKTVVKLVRGVGINDADYAISEYRVDKKRERVICPFYRTWDSMLKRCYSEGFQKGHTTYKGCEVCNHWKLFSNFRKWMVLQDWSGKQLDKDILIVGNKIYSPETCVFVGAKTNSFLINSLKSRGKYSVGVYWNKVREKFSATCSNSFTKKSENLGCFKTELEAHLAWKKRKHELACQLADLQTDSRVAEALRVRFL